MLNFSIVSCQVLTYNDDIQGTAAVCVDGLFGAMRLKKPTADLREELKKETSSSTAQAPQLLVP